MCCAYECCFVSGRRIVVIQVEITEVHVLFWFAENRPRNHLLSPMMKVKLRQRVQY